MKKLIIPLLLAASVANAATRSPEHCVSQTATANTFANLPHWQYNVHTTIVTGTSVLNDITIVGCFIDKATCDVSRAQLNPPNGTGVVTWPVLNQSGTRVVGPCYTAGD